MNSFRSLTLVAAAVLTLAALPNSGYAAAAAGGRGGGGASAGGGGGATGGGGGQGSGNGRDIVSSDVAIPRLPPRVVIRPVSLKVHCRGGHVIVDDETGIEYRSCRDWPE